MRKLLVLTLVSGRVITRDYTFLIPGPDQGGPPIGAPANDEFYARFCQGFAQFGYTDPDQVSDTLYTHISPSQIATVQIKFEKYGS